jgi:hypothetical protein
LNHATHDDSNDDSESGESEVDPSHDFDELELADLYDNEGDARLEEWSSGIKRDPVRHARRIVSRSGHRVDVQRQSRNAGVEEFSTSNFKVAVYKK